MPARFLSQCSFSSASSLLQQSSSSAATRKAFREIMSQKRMWVNNALQFWKGHSWSSTEINIIGVWKAVLSSCWEADREKVPASPGLQSPGGGRRGGTPAPSSLTTLLHLCCHWPPGSFLPARPLPSNGKQTTCVSKQLLNDFLPQQSQNIKHILKRKKKKWHQSLEKFYDLVTAACKVTAWPGLALSACQTMKQCYY